MNPTRYREMLRAKIHRITVTQADLEYEGSLTLDRDLMDAADIAPFEKVEVYNVTRGSRFATYAIEGGRGTGVCCVNGAAAHLASVGNRLIVCCYAAVPEADARTHEPFIVLVDAENRAHTVKRGELEGVRFRDAPNSLVVRPLKQ